MTTTTTILAAGVLLGGAVAADPSQALPHTVSGAADNNVMAFAVSLANEGAGPEQAFATAPMLDVAARDNSGLPLLKGIGTGEPNLLQSGADNEASKPIDTSSKTEQRATEIAACTDHDVKSRDLSLAIQSSVAERPSVTKFLVEVQHGAALQLDTLHGGQGRTRSHQPRAREASDLTGSEEHTNRNATEATVVNVVVQTATPVVMDMVPPSPCHCQLKAVTQVDSDPLVVPVPSVSPINSNSRTGEAPTTCEQDAVPAKQPAFPDLVPVSMSPEPIVGTLCLVRNENNPFYGVPAATGDRTGSLPSSKRLQKEVTINDLASSEDELSASLLTGTSDEEEPCSLPESVRVSRNGLLEKQDNGSNVTIQTNMTVPTNGDVPRKEADTIGVLSEIKRASSQVNDAGSFASYTPANQADPVTGNVVNRRTLVVSKATRTPQQVVPGTVQPVFASALQGLGAQETALNKPGGTISREQPTPLTINAQSVMAAHQEVMPAQMSGAKQANTIEVGIHDSQLGQLRIQTVVNSSGEIQVGLAGQRAESQVVLEQIAPLLHAAISQQADVHGMFTPVHVFTIGTVTAMSGGSARQDSGSQSDPMSYTAAGSGSAHSQHSANHQARQEAQQAQRRGGDAANSATANWPEREQTTLPHQYAFQGAPTVTDHGGLSIRI